jgi:hypothetical protein
MRVLALSLAIGLLGSAAYAADACGVPGACDPGRGPTCEKQCFYNCKECPKCGSKLVCKVVCGTKEVKKTVYNVKVEPFCTSLPGCGRCNDCGDPGCGGDCGTATCADQSCGKCKNCCDPCAAENAKKFVPPKCGTVRCKKTLEIKEVICKVPSYKCVPVCPCCDGCGSGCNSGCGTEGAPATGEKPADAKATTMQRLPMAPLPPVIGTSYRQPVGR